MLRARILVAGAAHCAVGFAVALALPPAAAQSVLYTFGPEAPSAELGQSVAGGADVDGDGLPDILVGAPLDGTLVYAGGAVDVLRGITGAPMAKLLGELELGRLGVSVAFVGDIDLDGVPDFAAGAPHDWGAGPLPSLVTLYDGATFAKRWTVTGAPGDHLGQSVASAGDVNQDGVPDIAAGAPGKGVGGRAFVLSGVDGSILRQYEGDAPGDVCGWSVASAGDMDLDGWPDLLVGAPKADGAGADAGIARVYSGASSLPLFAVYGDAPSDQLGWSLAGPGDTDGDGHPDLLIGVRLDDVAGVNSGSALLYSGATGALLHVFSSDGGGDLAGSSVAGVGDLDADGLADVLVGIPADASLGKNTGAVRAFSGGSGALLFALTGPKAFSGYGESVAGAGDIDADSAPDLVIGAPVHVSGGQAWIISSAECASIEEYGSGCAGSGGFVPHLQLTGCATPGSSVGLLLTEALGGALALVFVGPEPVSIPIKGGCTALVDPLPGVLVLTLTGVGPGQGSATHVGVIPADTLPGTSFAVQALVLEPGMPTGLATSNGVHVILP